MEFVHFREGRPLCRPIYLHFPRRVRNAHRVPIRQPPIGANVAALLTMLCPEGQRVQEKRVGAGASVPKGQEHSARGFDPGEHVQSASRPEGAQDSERLVSKRIL